MPCRYKEIRNKINADEIQRNSIWIHNKYPDTTYIKIILSPSGSSGK